MDFIAQPNKEDLYKDQSVRQNGSGKLAKTKSRKTTLTKEGMDSVYSSDFWNEKEPRLNLSTIFYGKKKHCCNNKLKRQLFNHEIYFIHVSGTLSAEKSVALVFSSPSISPNVCHYQHKIL